MPQRRLVLGTTPELPSWIISTFFIHLYYSLSSCFSSQLLLHPKKQVLPLYCPDPHIWAGKRRQDLDHLCCGVGRGRWLPGEQVRVWWRGGPASLAAGRNAEPPSRWFPPQTTPGVASPVAGAAAMRNEGRPVPSTTPVPVPRASSRRSLGWMPSGTRDTSHPPLEGGKKPTTDTRKTGNSQEM